MTRIIQKIEAGLYRRGFVHEETRILVRNQLALTLVVVLIGCIGGWAWPRLFDFAAGAVLASWNFYFLSKFVHRVLEKQQAAVTGMLFRFYGRLILTGVALYALIVMGGSSVIALLAGLSTVVVTVLIWAVTRMRGKNIKEA
ncbi:ATP synthase subunit I [Desulfovibrio ferrophilus]|uniref:ATP synthase I chain n=1 Tax=Desulfovibrio ferrophilus TaxID=241368 RepID=A0A2Z6B2A6_9BACT|nr:ATP synthase subunit I [Desulfovibrio ferrophilus]BBD09634.1 ATP synthase I chain [Desulfovibrio ferrophilus]